MEEEPVHVLGMNELLEATAISYGPCCRDIYAGVRQMSGVSQLVAFIPVRAVQLDLMAMLHN